PGIEAFREALSPHLADSGEDSLGQQATVWRDRGVPLDMAESVAALRGMYGAPDVVRLATQCGVAVDAAARAWFAIGRRFDLDWLRRASASLHGGSSWQQLAVETFVDDLFGHQATLTARTLDAGPSEVSGEGITGDPDIGRWIALHEAAVHRYDRILEDVRSAGTLEVAMLGVINGQLRALAAA